MFFVFTIIYCMVNNPLFNSKPAMLFYIIAGLNAGIYKLTGEEVKIREKRLTILQIRSEFRITAWNAEPGNRPGNETQGP